MDLLGELLLSVRIDANSIGVLHAGADWGITMPVMERSAATLYSVLHAPCLLLREGKDDLPLVPGDSAIVLRDTAVAFASASCVSRVPFIELWRRQGLPEEFSARSRRSAPIHFGFDAPDRTPRLLTIAYMFHEPERSPLLSGLSDVVVLRGGGSASLPWLEATLDWLTSEDIARKPGYLAPASLLAELVLTSFLREHLLSAPLAGAGWLQALTDPRMARALTAMHSQPELTWTVVTLAREASLSRAAFARRFTALLGQSPIQYLIGCRMRYAARSLTDGRVTVAALAERYGYRSESAFRTAFRKHFGMAPQAFARSTRTAKNDEEPVERHRDGMQESLLR